MDNLWDREFIGVFRGDATVSPKSQLTKGVYYGKFNKNNIWYN